MSPTAVIQLGSQVTVINNMLVRNLISKSLDNNGQYNVQRHPKNGHYTIFVHLILQFFPYRTHLLSRIPIILQIQFLPL